MEIQFGVYDWGFKAIEIWFIKEGCSFVFFNLCLDIQY